MHSPGGTYAEGLNNKGQVVGYFSNSGMDFEGFIYDSINNTYVTLNDPNAVNGTFTIATGINDSGQVVGYYYDGVYDGFLYDPATKTYTTIKDPNLYYTQPNGINNAGLVVGNGFAYDSVTNTYTSIAGNIQGVNNSGQLVGWDFIATPAVPIPATIWLFGSILASYIGFSRSKLFK